jgi:hypothetical protein
MRTRWLGGLVVLGLFAVASPAEAQFITGSNYNPFNLYYGWYLPQQAALAARPRPSDAINVLSAARQRTASTERSTLYDPAGGYGLTDRFDPSMPFADRQQVRRGSGGLATMGTNVNGAGPGAYYNRASSFFPGLRAGRGPNANAAAAPVRQGGFGGSSFNPYGFGR